VRKEILGWILRKCPDGSTQHIEGKALDLANSKARSSDINSVNSVFNDLHRQFTGLGLIDEIRETEYQNPPYFLQFQSVVNSSGPPAPRPVTVTRWRLTRRGEHHIAKLAGFIRTDGEPAKEQQDAPS
jgi:hypothetical protein